MREHITLTQFIIERQRTMPAASGSFTLLLNDIVTACKRIAHLVNRGDLIGVLGSAGTQNIQGDVQKKLDIITHDIMVSALGWSGHVSGMASEEAEALIPVSGQYAKGQYLVLFDPLDGSSNIDINLTVGTIFSILRCSEGAEPELKDFLRPGREQVCAGFVLYGPSTLLVLTTGNGVDAFTLDQDIGEFILTHRNLRIPDETSEFAINMSNQRFWEAPVKRYVDECVAGSDGPRGRNFNMRWIASLVADVYRILNRGGVFLYPYDVRDSSRAGRLRLMYEANPMAFIVEQAGGLCSSGRQRIMDIEPGDIHQRVPLIFGSRNEVERIVNYYASADD
ncbi:MAG: class 1 fructose-bisphosphatase [Methylomonas sp.]|nr:class 1 fructose-bisphosphatase [Methylomonas sp.]PPD21596.1 MAG: class 1 fructose-bisphosphatase [Methylomonas sp.]PPD26393.1 MAG: class 1 fructose-bisphosphatase [Methylomonas sp.]PPD38132.1 MAG: class 1 fructose-bisphosphatase [Methylomonas sp.]PPD53402.1 MAG: class 1 fructose-bisphosphatase [Methylomonas sp.]